MALISYKSFTNSIKKQNPLPLVHFKMELHHANINESISVELIESNVMDYNPPRVGKEQKKWHEQENPHMGWWGETNDVLMKRHPNFEGDDKEAIEQYTHKNGGSAKFNRALLDTSRSITKKNHAHMTRLHKLAAPLGHHVNLFSGVETDPRTWKKESDGSIKLPAFSSLTVNKDVAYRFGHHRVLQRDKSNDSNSKDLSDVHIMHVHAKPEHRALSVSKYSKFPDEVETTLPPDTHIAPHPEHKKPDVYTNSDGRRVIVHHYIITHQSNDWKPSNPVKR